MLTAIPPISINSFLHCEPVLNAKLTNTNDPIVSYMTTSTELVDNRHLAKYFIATSLLP